MARQGYSRSRPTSYRPPDGPSAVAHQGCGPDEGHPRNRLLGRSREAGKRHACREAEQSQQIRGNPRKHARTLTQAPPGRNEVCMNEFLPAEQTDLSTHVESCVRRYENLSKRLNRIEMAVYALIVLILLGGGITVKELAPIAAALAGMK